MRNPQLVGCDQVVKNLDPFQGGMSEEQQHNLLYADWGLAEAFWANPLNMVGSSELLSETIGTPFSQWDHSKVTYWAAWNIGVPGVGAALGGSFVAPTFAVSSIGGAAALGFGVGAMSGMYLVWQVRTDPQKRAVLDKTFSAASSTGPSTRPFSITPGFGSMV